MAASLTFFLVASIKMGTSSSIEEGGGGTGGKEYTAAWELGKALALFIGMSVLLTTMNYSMPKSQPINWPRTNAKPGLTDKPSDGTTSDIASTFLVLLFMYMVFPAALGAAVAEKMLRVPWFNGALVGGTIGFVVLYGTTQQSHPKECRTGRC